MNEKLEISVDFYELSEQELRSFVQDILDQLELYLKTNKKYQSSTPTAKTERT